MAEAMHVISGGHFGDMYRDLELLLLQDGNLFGLLDALQVLGYFLIS